MTAAQNYPHLGSLGWESVCLALLVRNPRREASLWPRFHVLLGPVTENCCSPRGETQERKPSPVLSSQDSPRPPGLKRDSSFPSSCSQSCREPRFSWHQCRHPGPRDFIRDPLSLFWDVNFSDMGPWKGHLFHLGLFMALY